MLKKFISYYKPHKKLFFIDMFFAFLISAIDLVFPMVSRELVNNVIPDKRLDLLIKWSILLVILFVIRYIGNYIVSYWGHVLEYILSMICERNYLPIYRPCPLAITIIQNWPHHVQIG